MIYVDGDEIENGANSITDSIQNIEAYIDFMNHKLDIAAEDLEGTSFERVSERISLVIDALNSMEEKLEIVKVYLYKLIDCINRYNELKY